MSRDSYGRNDFVGLTHKIDSKYNENDNTYFNVTIFNRNVSLDRPIGTSQEIKYNVTQDQAIISKANECYLAVSQLQLPNNDIPLFFFRDNFYYITLQNGAAISTQPLVWSPSQSNYTGVYTIQSFLDSINAALVLAAIAVGIAAINTPYVYLDKNLNVLKLVFPGLDAITNNWLSPNPNNLAIPGTYAMYMNWNLFNYFQSMQVYFYNQFTLGLDYRILVKNNLDDNFVNNQRYTMSQEVSLLFLFRDVEQILVTTSLLPVSREQFNGFDQDGNTIEFGVLANFAPIASGSPSELFTPYYYFPETYKLNDLIGYGEIKKLDFQIQWVDKNRRVYPVYLLPGQSMQIKFAFLNKSLFNNKFNTSNNRQFYEGDEYYIN